MTCPLHQPRMQAAVAHDWCGPEYYQLTLFFPESAKTSTNEMHCPQFTSCINPYE